MTIVTTECNENKLSALRLEGLQKGDGEKTKILFGFCFDRLSFILERLPPTRSFPPEIIFTSSLFPELAQSMPRGGLNLNLKTRVAEKLRAPLGELGHVPERCEPR
jgi:hypothetical protein